MSMMDHDIVRRGSHTRLNLTTPRFSPQRAHSLSAALRRLRMTTMADALAFCPFAFFQAVQVSSGDATRHFSNTSHTACFAIRDRQVP